MNNLDKRMYTIECITESAILWEYKWEVNYIFLNINVLKGVL